jgi:ABC-type nitrate/sulfonate/bicarbonate transport system ATPase subunit
MRRPRFRVRRVLLMSPKLAVVDVTKTFAAARTAGDGAAGGRLEVLRGVSLSVDPRECVALVGPSGCGKSTLCNIIAGVVLPDSGAVRLDGESLLGRRGRVAYMQQKDLLLPWRRVIDNAVLGLEVQGVPRTEARSEARALLQRFGLDRFERYYPALLSGGMRQRVALVRTLLCRKDLVVLDEPFGALDAMTRAAMRRYLVGLVEEFDRTILFVTHDIEEAAVVADRVYVMSARPGRIRGEFRMQGRRPRDPFGRSVAEDKAAIMQVLQDDLAEALL